MHWRVEELVGLTRVLANPRPRSGATGGRSYLMPEARDIGREELPHSRGQGQRLRSNAASEEQWLRGRRRAGRSYSTFKVRRGGGEEIPLVQGEVRQLRFAGAAVKR